MIWLITILGLVLRLVNLNQSFWLDEASQVTLSSKSIYSIWFERVGDFHPPLSYLLFHFWLQISSSEWVIRLLPVILGAATIPVTYLIGQKFFSKKVALLSSLLMAIAPYHIYYSQEVRMYSLAALLACLSTYYLIISLEKNNLSHKLIYIISTTALIYSHYLTIFVLVSQLTFVFLVRRKDFKKILILITVAVIFYLPWIPQLLIQLQNGVSPDQYLPGWSNLLATNFIKAIPLILIKFMIGRVNFDNKIIYGEVFLGSCLIFLPTLFFAFKKIKRKQTLMLWWLILPVVLSLLLSFFIPVFQPFRLLFILPPFYILLASGLENSGRVKAWLTGLLVIISLGGLFMYYLNPMFWREDWRGAVGFVVNNLSSNDEVVFAWSEPFPPYLWYGKNIQAVGVVKKFPATIDNVNQSMSDLAVKDRIFFFQYLQPLSDPNRLVQRWLITHQFQEVITYDFKGVGFVTLYKRR